MLPFSQLDDVCRLLDEHKVRYSVEEEVISLDGGPEIAAIDFGRNANALAVQAILDSVPSGVRPEWHEDNPKPV
jgi:hypothetical protein